MNLPDILKGDSPVRLFQGAVVGAALAATIGFGWGGWTLGGTVQKLLEARDTTHRVEMCALKFNAQPDAAAQFAAYKLLGYNEQSTYFDKGGWAADSKGTTTYEVRSGCLSAIEAALKPKTAAN